MLSYGILYFFTYTVRCLGLITDLYYCLFCCCYSHDVVLVLGFRLTLDDGEGLCYAMTVFFGD